MFTVWDAGSVPCSVRSIIDTGAIILFLPRYRCAPSRARPPSLLLVANLGGGTSSIYDPTLFVGYFRTICVGALLAKPVPPPSS